MIQSQVGQSFLVCTLFIAAAISLQKDEFVPDETCVCAVQDAPLYSSAGYEHHIVQYLLANTCTFSAGDNTTIYGSYWYNLKVPDLVLWTSGDYLAKGKTRNGNCGLP